MKTFLFVFILFTAFARGGITVIDPTLIATNNKNSAQEVYELILQELNQQTSIGQFDDYLERVGSLEEPTAEQAFEILIYLLNSQPEHLPSETKSEEVEDNTIFTQNPDTAYEAVEEEIIYGNEVIGQRDGKNYRPEAAARADFERYAEMRNAVIERKATLLASLQDATARLQAATTTSEVQKLSGLILSINTQLMAIENDLNLVGQDALTRMLQNQNEEALRRKQFRETEKAKLRHAHEKDIELFRLVEGRVPLNLSN